MATIHDLTREELLHELLEFEAAVAQILAYHRLDVRYDIDYPSRCEYEDEVDTSVSDISNPASAASTDADVEFIPPLPPEALVAEEKIPPLPPEAILEPVLKR